MQKATASSRWGKSWMAGAAGPWARLPGRTNMLAAARCMQAGSFTCGNPLLSADDNLVQNTLLGAILRVGAPSLAPVRHLVMRRQCAAGNELGVQC